MNYDEIIEMEVLNGIDRALHMLLLEYKNRRSNGVDAFSTVAIQKLKQKLPEYIDKQTQTIILDNLSKTVRIVPPISE